MNKKYYKNRFTFEAYSIKIDEQNRHRDKGGYG